MTELDDVVTNLSGLESEHCDAASAIWERSCCWSAKQHDE